MKVGGEVLQLQPLDHLRDEPATRSSVAKVLELMKEGKDWANLPGFLEGLKTAKRKLKGWQIEKLVRKANACGRQGVVLVCLQRVERTGVGLWDSNVARECMLGAVMRAMEGGWTKERVEDGWRLGRQYWELTWDKRHHSSDGGNAKLNVGVVGSMVLLNAARVVKAGEGIEDVEKFAQRLTSLLGPDWAEEMRAKENKGWVEANQDLVIYGPVLKGMQLAQRVLGKDSELGRDLRKRVEKDLEPMLQKALATVNANTPQDGSRRGAKLYGDLAEADL